MTANYLYASYTASKTIGVFATSPGCELTFMQDVPAAGLQGGAATGMAVNGNLLVVAYGDGSIQSFNVAGGVPVPDADLQNSSGYAGPASTSGFTTDNLPSGVDISREGKFAVLATSHRQAWWKFQSLLTESFSEPLLTILAKEWMPARFD
jgi:hypothetical protein